MWRPMRRLHTMTGEGTVWVKTTDAGVGSLREVISNPEIGSSSHT